MAKIDNQGTGTSRPTPHNHIAEGENRRLRGNRLEIFMPVSATTLRGDLIQGFLESVNLSWAGMLVETTIPWNIGDLFFVEFILPDSTCSVRVKVKVVRRQASVISEDLTSVGLLFEEMDPNARRMLSGFILENLPDA